MMIRTPRVLFSTLFLITLGLAASAMTSPLEVSRLLRNPQIRACTTNVWTFDTFPFPPDDKAYCRDSSGRVVVDAMTIVLNSETTTTLAANTILMEAVGSTCADVGAEEYSLPAGDVVCVYRDGSLLALETVRAGLSDSIRRRLKEVLLTR